ncbi:MAG: DUF2520 domain-containing protein, partial [Deltaproteobacteria bacterium]|nr:DUF2520 domain-containing protein [Deltaproteobacteria bacterium]
MSKAIDLLIIGRGRVGRSLGRAFRRAQRSVRIWSGRAFMANPLPSLPPASVIWITVSDPHIEAVSRHLSSALGKAGFLPSIAHASGALPPSVLWACRERGAPIAAAHPCLSFGSARTPLKGGVFVLDGDPHAIDALSRLILDLEGKPIIKGVHGPRYHAALALAANGSGALAALASSALEAMGFTPPESRAILSGLLHSLALNIRRMGPAEALTLSLIHI